VMKEFNITRNTAKRRIGYLSEKGMINIMKSGRFRVLEITDCGREIFTS